MNYKVHQTKKEREAFEKAYWDRLDKEVPEREMTLENSQRMLCRQCMKYASIVIGGYGFTREDPWKLYRCDCKYKYVWVYTIKSS